MESKKITTLLLVSICILLIGNLIIQLISLYRTPESITIVDIRKAKTQKEKQILFQKIPLIRVQGGSLDANVTNSELDVNVTN